jgi:hypothetical protein
MLANINKYASLSPSFQNEDVSLATQRKAGIISLLGETAYETTIYGIKLCLLTIYTRLS